MRSAAVPLFCPVRALIHEFRTFADALDDCNESPGRLVMTP
jgi:hypothetical protein